MQCNQKDKAYNRYNMSSSNNQRTDTRGNNRRDDRRGERYIPRDGEDRRDDRRSERYIPREDPRDDRRRDDRPRDDRRGERYIPREDPRDDRRREDPRDDRRPRDAYYEAFEGVYGGDVARSMYGESAAPITTPSICIPRTFPTIRGEQTKRAVFRTFRELRIGIIDRIDTVHKTDKNDERFCTVYIHMKRWNVTNQLALETRQKLLDGKEIKVVYDEPWFWKCTASNMEKPENRYSEGASRNTARPRIDLGDGVNALSRYTQRDENCSGSDGERSEGGERKEQEHEQEQHNPEQLCNMSPSDGEE
jgi:hypothetical protein